MTNPAPAWSVDVLTLFPDMFPGPLGQSLAGRALEDGVWRLNAVCLLYTSPSPRD